MSVSKAFTFMQRRVALLSLIVMASPSGVRAADRGPLSFELRTGVQHDSNVIVEQTDVNTSRADDAVLLGASAKYRFAKFGKTELSVGYSFDETVHANLTDYDLQIHRASLEGMTRIGKLAIGADARFFHILLGGKPFLNMQTVSPSISGFISKRLLVRGGYTYVRKVFSTAKSLDADTHNTDASASYFFMRRLGYVNLALRYERERTTDPTRAFDGLQVSGNVLIPSDSALKGSKVRLGVGYRDRRYKNITPSIGAARHEQRVSVNASADIPVVKHVILRPEFRMADRASNDPFRNYDNAISSLSVVCIF
ncbi:hypothetical protein [Sphingorhabdus sp. EL138]|uniref:hypothetical protein n=1 Tax=Sphingorhabdus sp. EL138 TaxID=2073156 RepID=UPI0025D4564B|nr:hypothetical protein [Sphingorhabdus sp. EL138]